MPASRADQVLVLKRVEQAYGSLLDGNSVNIVVSALMEEHKVSQAQAYKYVKDAMARIYEKTDKNFENIYDRHYKRLERLYARCMQTKDLRAARQVLKDMADLFGLDAPKRTDITTGGEKLATFVDVLGVKVKPKPPEKAEEKQDADKTEG